MNIILILIFLLIVITCVAIYCKSIRKLHGSFILPATETTQEKFEENQLLKYNTSVRDVNKINVLRLMSNPLAVVCDKYAPYSSASHDETFRLMTYLNVPCASDSVLTESDIILPPSSVSTVMLTIPAVMKMDPSNPTDPINSKTRDYRKILRQVTDLDRVIHVDIGNPTIYHSGVVIPPALSTGDATFQGYTVKDTEKFFVANPDMRAVYGAYGLSFKIGGIRHIHANLIRSDIDEILHIPLIRSNGTSVITNYHLIVPDDGGGYGGLKVHNSIFNLLAKDGILLNRDNGIRTEDNWRDTAADINYTRRIDGIDYKIVREHFDNILNKELSNKIRSINNSLCDIIEFPNAYDTYTSMCCTVKAEFYAAMFLFGLSSNSKRFLGDAHKYYVKYKKIPPSTISKPQLCTNGYIYYWVPVEEEPQT